MNKYIRLSILHLFTLSLLSACQSRTEVPPTAQQADTVAAKPSAARNQPVPQPPSFSTANKGRIESVREIPVFSRIAEQIVMFGVENTGQYVKKGQVVARLSDAALQERILHCRARLEKAEFQYQAILMGQGYKRDHLDAAPENLQRLARINSGYNEVKTELHELEHRLSYCTITAPVSGYVSRIQNTLYGAAVPGEALFYIVDIEHLKVGFDVLENELARYEAGARVFVTTIAYPAEQHAATISGLNPIIDDNGMVHIEATLEPHPHLIPGMTAFVTIEPVK